MQIQKYIADKKIIQNYAQMKYKWLVTAIKPLKNKLFSVTSNPSTLVYFMSSMSSGGGMFYVGSSPIINN